MEMTLANMIGLTIAALVAAFGAPVLIHWLERRRLK